MAGCRLKNAEDVSSDEGDGSLRTCSIAGSGIASAVRCRRIMSWRTSGSILPPWGLPAGARVPVGDFAGDVSVGSCRGPKASPAVDCRTLTANTGASAKARSKGRGRKTATAHL